MKQIIEKKSMLTPYLGLAIASFAAFLAIMTMGRLSTLAIGAVEDFSIGIPLILVSLFIPVFEKLPSAYQTVIKTVNLIVELIGSFFCLLGLQKCFSLVSDRAAVNFTVFGILIFLLILSTGIYELVFKDLKTGAENG